MYLRSANTATGTLTPDGRYSAVSARNIDMQLTGKLDNHGNLIAKDTAIIDANNVNNTGTVQGDFVKIGTNNDLTNHGTLHANSAMSLDAKNRIMSQSPTTTQTNTQGRSSSIRTDLSQIATISVGSGLKDKTDEHGKPLTTLSIQAGNHILNKAANIQNTGGSTHMTAKNGIVTTAITTSNQINAIGDDNNYFKYSQSTDVGSNITSLGNLTLATTGKDADINIKGSHLDSVTGTTAIIGTGDVGITEGRRTQSLDTASKFTDKGLLSNSTIQNSHQANSDTSIQSSIGGERVVMKAGGDMQIVATKVLADRDVTLVSDGKISIDAGANNQTTHQQSSVKKSGLVDISPTSLTIGRQTTDQTSKAVLKTHTGSTVAALGGDVTVVANQSYHQTGSDVLAFKSDSVNPQTAQARSMPEGGNVDIFASSIAVENATESQTTTNDFRFKQSGVSVSVSNPIVDLGMQAYNMYQAAEKTDNERSRRLAALSVAGDGWMAWSEYQEQKNQFNNPNKDKAGNNPLNDFKITATIGSQSSQSNSTGYQEFNKASNIRADNITLHAFGDKDGDVNIVGSQLVADNRATLIAGNDINVLSSTQSQYSMSDNKNHSVGIGAYVSVGADTSFGLTASGSVGRGDTNASGQTQTNSQVSSGKLLILDSANDTNIKGATTRGEQVLARVGGDLNIHSRSDSHQLEGKQRQYGGSINVGLGATMPVSGSVSAELGDNHVNYHAVREQSGIYAGKDGFDIAVDGHTDLLGAVIDSKATPDKNRLTTTTFRSADITNISEAESTVKSYGIDSQVFSGNLYPIAKTIIANTVGQGSDVNHHETSQTISAIADGELIAADADSQARLDAISHDTANTHRYIALANIDEMMADAKAQQFIKDATVDTLFKYSDEAHRKMFIAEAPLYRVTKDEKGELVFTQIEGKEKEKLLKDKGTSPRVFTNGIFNGVEAAGKYAIQNRKEKDNEKVGKEIDLNENPVYFVHFPKTNNLVSEMMVAAYQKYLESDTLGLTNATKEVKSMIQTYGETGLQMDGHSRGTLTITNAYSSLLNDGDAGKYSNLRTNMVGAAANVKNADRKLAELQGRNTGNYTEQQKSDMSIHVQGHTADPVHGIIGFNSSTGGTVSTKEVGKLKETALIIKEATKAVAGVKTSAHNCYGVGTPDCNRQGLLENNKSMTWEPVYKLKINSTTNTIESQETQKESDK